MSKKPTISKEAEVLLKLLRIALGNEGDCTLPEDVDWKEVVRLSYEHKVSALAVDGLQMTGVDLYDGLTEEKANALKSVLVPWIKDVENTEWSYCYYVEVLKTLCQIFKDNGLTPIILKGYGLSLNYPRPSHRGAGDIDIFLIDKDGKPAAEEGVEIVEKVLGIKTKKVPHDYEFEFKGLEVELHYDATNAYWESETETYIVERLREMLVEGCTPCPGIEGALLPSANFNAVYLMRHSFGHFYTATGNMRQYVDWVLFLQHHHSEVDWDSVRQEWRKCGLQPYADGLCTMIGKWLKLDGQLCPTESDEARTEEYTLRDMGRTIPNGRHLHQRVRYYYGNREKLRFITGKWWMRLLGESVSTSVKQLLNNASHSRRC